MTWDEIVSCAQHVYVNDMSKAATGFNESVNYHHLIASAKNISKVLCDRTVEKKCCRIFHILCYVFEFLDFSLSIQVIHKIRILR